MFHLKNIAKLMFILLLLSTYIAFFGRISVLDYMKDGTIVTFHEEDLQTFMQPGLISKVQT